MDRARKGIVGTRARTRLAQGRVWWELHIYRGSGSRARPAGNRLARRANRARDRGGTASSNLVCSTGESSAKRRRAAHKIHRSRTQMHPIAPDPQLFVRIRRSAGEHRTRRTLANRRLRRHWPPDAMPRRCCEFVDSRLRRSPPDRASAVPYRQAGENAMRFPRLAHRSEAAHKLHSTLQRDRMNLISGNLKISSRLPAFSLFLPGKLSKRPGPSHLLCVTRFTFGAEQM
jgi:hypothetical protein